MITFIHNQCATPSRLQYSASRCHLMAGSPRIWRSPADMLAAVGITVAAFVAVSSTSRGQASDGDDVIKEIHAAWVERNSQIDSVEFVWTETTTVGKGMLDVFSLFNPGRKDMSLQDLRRSVPGITLRIQGPHIYYEREAISQEKWQNGAPGPRLVSGYDGKLSRMLDREARDYPTGSIFQRPQFIDIETLSIKPVMLAFRSASPDLLNLNIAKWSVVSRKASFDGQLCTVVENADGALKRSLWLDVSREFSPVRYFEGPTGRPPNVQLKIEYEDDPRYGLVPKRWSGGFLGPKGEVREGVDVEVNSYRLNVQLPKDQLEIRFPPGTWVQDERFDDPYIIREGGERRFVTSAERKRNVSYEELLSTESGMAGLTFWQRIGRSLLVWGSLATVGIVILLIWRERRRRSGDASLGNR